MRNSYTYVYNTNVYAYISFNKYPNITLYLTNSIVVSIDVAIYIGYIKAIATTSITTTTTTTTPPHTVKVRNLVTLTMSICTTCNQRHREHVTSMNKQHFINKLIYLYTYNDNCLSIGNYFVDDNYSITKR